MRARQRKKNGRKFRRMTLKKLDQLIALIALGEFDQVNAILLSSWPRGWLRILARQAAGDGES